MLKLVKNDLKYDKFLKCNMIVLFFVIDFFFNWVKLG